ncbi:MAG TPA: PEP-CTERM sorting domain-containing protein [Gemmatimonas sp.]|uniref:PEP-CTERM sorting domain-containing protein n=1 Tax=Gemmatimonas sp. TaxID=1962908 RepID=UPI002EDB9B95
MRFSKLTSFVAAAALTLAPVAAQAQLAVFTNFADFLAATSGASTDSFDDLSEGWSTSPLSRTAGTHNYTVSANTSGFYGVGTNADRWLSSEMSTDIVTFSGFDATVRGVGGFFFGTNFDGAFAQGFNVVVTATSASGSLSQLLVSPSTNSFLGFVATDDLLSLSFAMATPTVDAFPTVNNFVVAKAPTAVPEPSSMVLLLAGAAGMVVVLNRRRAA